MKKTVSILLALVMALSVFTVMTFAETSDFTYEVVSEEDKTCKITGAKTGIVDLVIPAEIDGYKVVAIGNRAFDKNTEVASIQIPDTVESIGQSAFVKTAFFKNDANWEDDVLYIGKFLIAAKTTLEGEYVVKSGTTVIADNAFRNCKKLTKVIMLNGVVSIGLLAFRDCTELTDVVLPSSLKNIGGYAFAGCTALTMVKLPDGLETLGKYSFNGSGLTEITIPASVKTVGDYAFCNCENLAEIKVDEENENYSSASGVLYNKDKSTVLYVPYKVDYSEFELPKTVTTIGKGAFEGATFEEFEVPESVTAIDEAAFANCENLKRIKVPSTVTTIADNSFSGSEDVVIDAEKGSFAYGYAEENDLLKKVLLGDVNGDGKISSIDARWTLQYVAMLRELNEEQFACADVNGDGKISSIDARWILQVVAGTRVL